MAPAVAEFCLSQAITLARGLQHADPLFRKAQEAYGMCLSFMKGVAYIFIVLVIILAFFNFFDDPTGSKHLPEEISDQYDPSGLSKK